MTPRVYRVLLADDSADLRALSRRALEATGRFSIAGEAADGEQAIDLAAAEQPDVVLLDLAMPKMDGLTALPRICEAAPRATVVVLSGLDADRSAPVAREKGAAAFMPKRLPLRVMVEQLLAYLEQDVSLAGGGGEHREAFVHLDATALSPSRARQFVTQTLESWDRPDLADIVLLLTSELVTNAVLHAGSAIDLTLTLDRGVLRIAVADRSASRPVIRDTGEEATHGRGMVLLDALAAAWSVVTTGAGKIVWFEVPAVAGGASTLDDAR